MNDERFFKLVDKEKFNKAVDELARETHIRCGVVLLQTLTFNHEEMQKLNDGPTEDMSDFCQMYERAVANRILEIGIENGKEAREELEKHRRGKI